MMKKRSREDLNIDLKLKALHPGQVRVVEHPAKYKVVVCGRRWGKTHMILDLLINDLLDGRTSAYGAPTRNMGSEVWRAIKQELGFLIGSGLIKPNETYRTLEMKTTGGYIEFWSLDVPDRIRGRKYHRWYIDEAALIPNIDTWLYVIQPTLLDFDGDAYFPTTPRGKNWIWTLFNRGKDPEQELWASFQMPTSNNPLMNPEVIKRYQKELPEATFSQEYLADFVDDAGMVFRGVDDIAILKRKEPYAGNFAFGVDFARKHDFTVIVVIDVDQKRMVDSKRFTGVSFSLQTNHLKALYDKWKPYRIVAEQNSIGYAVVESLIADGLPVRPFHTSLVSKPPLIENLQLAIEKGELWILDDEILTHELKAYEQTVLPSGRIRYSAPIGAHDDYVMALALAYDECKSMGQSFGGAMPRLWDEVSFV